jgi:hypothetical protein
MFTDTNENTAPEPGSEEYNAAMVAKLRGEDVPADDDTQDTEASEDTPKLPEGGQEKFFNAETGEYDWANHAKELEYRLAQVKGKSEGKPEDAPEDKSTDNEGDEEVVDVIQKAGLKAEDLETTLQTSGKLTDEQRESLIKSGIPGSMVDSYVEMYQASREAAQKAALDYVGGEDEWTKINAWVAKSLPADERDSYNAVLKGPDWKVAVDTLKFKMQASSKAAAEGKLTTGDSTVPGATKDGYESREQMKRDMSNPKYHTDPAFRLEVTRKIQNASWRAE